MHPSGVELAQLATLLSETVLRGMGPRSMFALKVGLEAAQVEGITGVVSLKIPAKQKDYIDVIFTAGPVDITTRGWGQAG